MRLIRCCNQTEARMTTPLRHTPLLPGTLQNLFYPPLENEYTYFKRAADVAFQSDDTIRKSAWAADAAMLAYARYGQRRMTDAELDANFDRAGLACEKIGGTPTDWNAPGTQAVFASCSDFALCAFRGTERDDPNDLLSDANILLVHESDYRPVSQDSRPPLGHLSFVSHLFAEPSLVHRGFQHALNQVWEKIHAAVTDYRRQYPQAEICFTGHSLGAALAVLAYSRFADPGISLYTFGCPRIGNAAFRDRVVSNTGRGIYRFVNYNDAVAHVPTESLFYRQTPEKCYRFDDDGNLDNEDSTFKGDVQSLQAAILGLPASIKPGDLNNIPAPPSLVDHSPARYCFRLWDFV
jgi:Lipase (class 3)